MQTLLWFHIGMPFWMPIESRQHHGFSMVFLIQYLQSVVAKSLSQIFRAFDFNFTVAGRVVTKSKTMQLYSQCCPKWIPNVLRMPLLWSSSGSWGGLVWQGMVTVCVTWHVHDLQCTLVSCSSPHERFCLQVNRPFPFPPKKIGNLKRYETILSPILTALSCLSGLTNVTMADYTVPWFCDSNLIFLSTMISRIDSSQKEQRVNLQGGNYHSWYT